MADAFLQGIIEDCFRGISSPITASASTSIFSPISVFSGGKMGALLDGLGWQNPSAPVGLWQDTGRTTPVTAAGQRVAAMDDSSGNNMHCIQGTINMQPTFVGVPTSLGSELISDGGFATGAPWTTGAGVSIAAGVATFTASSGDLSQTVSVTSGKVYVLTYDIVSFTSGDIQPKFTGGTTTNSRVSRIVGSYYNFIRAEAGNTTFVITEISATMSIDNVSLKEVLAWTGPYGLHSDGANDSLRTSSTHTLQLPAFLMMTWTPFMTINANGVFSDALDSSNQILLAPVSGLAYSRIRNAAGNLDFQSGAGQIAIGTPAVWGSLHIVGTSDIQVNSNTLVSGANTWLVGTQILLSRFGLSANTSQTDAGIFYGGIILLADPGATNRAKLKTYFGAIAGLTL